MRIIKRHTLIKPATDYVIDAPTPSNISYWWNVGSLLGLSLGIQIITGVTLAMHYNASVTEAFNSVEHIMRDVNNGWLIRYLHANTASAFFFLVYLHIGRGLYYGSYKAPRTLTWTLGTIMLVLMMGTAFLGYVLPYGQMSLWGATVITNLMSAIPWIGQDVVEFVWGGFSVNNATLNRFFSLHFVLPFVLAALALMHLIALHDSAGANNPLGISANYDRIPFAPYFLFKDVITIFIFMWVLSLIVFFMPNVLGDSENYVMANPMQTPPAIVPEWYLLPFYAILRSIPNKLIGVISMFSAILIILAMTFGDVAKLRGNQFKPFNKALFFIFVGNLLLLLVLGAKHVESPFIEAGQIATLAYFVYFGFIVPMNTTFENSINELYTFVKNIVTGLKSKLDAPSPFVSVGLPLHSGAYMSTIQEYIAQAQAQTQAQPQQDTSNDQDNSEENKSEDNIPSDHSSEYETSDSSVEEAREARDTGAYDNNERGSYPTRFQDGFSPTPEQNQEIIDGTNRPDLDPNTNPNVEPNPYIDPTRSRNPNTNTGCNENPSSESNKNACAIHDFDNIIGNNNVTNGIILSIITLSFACISIFVPEIINWIFACININIVDIKDYVIGCGDATINTIPLIFSYVNMCIIEVNNIINDLIFCNVAHCDAPTPWGLYFQDSASPQMEALAEFHDGIMGYLVGILFSVALVMYACRKFFRYVLSRKYINHGSLVEIIWTISPGIILLLIAFTSFKLLYLMDEVSDVNMTLYIEGHQWYWSYQYPDFLNDDGDFIEYDSYLTPESDLEPGALRMLDVDERVIIPEMTHVRFIVTSGDVIHCYACPSLGIKADAYPGRLNQASALINRLGTFYGQCSEICGILHSSMPIAIESVSLEKFLLFLWDK